MMVGYWNDPAATAEALRDGWMHTGDLARCDDDGYYWFVSRKKEIIIRGGSNISPLEVEEVLDDHPAVHLSCVVGVPDQHLGEIVAAYVALREDIAPLPTVDELRRFVAERLAAYKVPERIIILPELPLNATGKVDRKKLHALVRQT
jgi:long-chain acyl-CoA synthetase